MSKDPKVGFSRGLQKGNLTAYVQTGESKRRRWMRAIKRQEKEQQRENLKESQKKEGKEEKKNQSNLFSTQNETKKDSAQS